MKKMMMFVEREKHETPLKIAAAAGAENLANGTDART